MKPYERRWLEEKIELPHAARPLKDDSEHPFVSSLNKLIEERDMELVKEIASKKQKALVDAQALLDKAHGLESERRAFVPEKLRRS